jgi:hypothetical protein
VTKKAKCFFIDNIFFLLIVRGREEECKRASGNQGGRVHGRFLENLYL